MVMSYTHICCLTGGTQSGAPDISNVSAQVREEATEDGCYGYGVIYGEVLLDIWDTAYGSYFVQLLGTKFVFL